MRAPKAVTETQNKLSAEMLSLQERAREAQRQAGKTMSFEEANQIINEWNKACPFPLRMISAEQYKGK